jgi:hypothetical protein
LFRRDWLRAWAETPRAADRDGPDSPRCLASKAPDFFVFLPNEGKSQRTIGELWQKCPPILYLLRLRDEENPFFVAEKTLYDDARTKSFATKDRNDSSIQSDCGACRR